MLLQLAEYGLIASIAGAAIATGGVLFLRRKRPVTPEEAERLRRHKVNQSRRTTQGSITDRVEDTLHYQYNVRGVTYFATQDASSLKHLLPAATLSLIGPVGVKYDPENPANSMVISEDWSGLRRNG